MEGDEMEMSKDELRKWIRENVKKSELNSTVLEKCDLLRLILERREKRAAHLLKLCESVAACEAIVKKQYSLLGWEYTDTDSDDDNIIACGNTTPPPCRIVLCKTQACSSPTTPVLPKLEDSKDLSRNNDKKSFICLKRQPVVVLTRLPSCMISSLRLPTPQNDYSEDESLNNLDSYMQWEPEGDSSHLDSSISSYNTGSNKRRKRDKNNEKLAMRHTTPQASTNTHAKRNATKTSTPKANGNTNAEGNTMKTSTPLENTNESALCQASDADTKPPPSVPQGEISVTMDVLARRRAMSWQQGKVMEIVEKEDGRLKYKISFEKGKSLVSGHHIAFACMPDLEQLLVGSRVVVKCQAEQPRFFPGILAELPSRKNRMRFLVFTDDHTPAYVSLPLLHLVFRPLTDPLDDIPDGTHKNFMREYMTWPYPPKTHYRVGQKLNAEFNGVQQRCEVLVVDCSLIKVVFKKDQHKEWIYRGSTRLEHMINKEKNKSTKVNECSKSAQ